MENQIINYEPTETQISVYSDISLYEQFSRMAESLCKSELVPQSYRNKPESCLLAIDMARQIGCKSPFFIMQNLNMIQGKPSWSGQYCTAIVRANFKNTHLEWVGDPKDENFGCRVIATDRYGNECKGTLVTMKMAKAEGWTNKNGSKWLTMPIQMLQYRAFAFFARVHCPEKLLGLYDEYETSDINAQRQRSSNVVNLENKLKEIAENIIEGEIEQ